MFALSSQARFFERESTVKRLAFVVLAFAAACGSGNSTVTDKGHTLQPQSAAMFSASVFFVNFAGIMVTDLPDTCGAVSQAVSGGTCGGGGNPLAAIPSGTALSIAVTPAGEGTFNVFGPDQDGGGSGGLPIGAQVVFTHQEAGATAFSDQAVSGTVTVDHFKAGEAASGSYDVTMQSGEHLSGHFDADDCPALDAALAAAGNLDGNGPGCSSSSSSADACTGTCNCGEQSVSAECQAPAGGSGDWTCTCTDAAGNTSTCTEPAPSSAIDACQQGTSCCPLSF